jgi:hypothetical protein
MQYVLMEPDLSRFRTLLICLLYLHRWVCNCRGFGRHMHAYTYRRWRERSRRGVVCVCVCGGGGGGGVQQPNTDKVQVGADLLFAQSCAAYASLALAVWERDTVGRWRRWWIPIPTDLGLGSARAHAYMQYCAAADREVFTGDMHACGRSIHTSIRPYAWVV